MTEAVRHLFNGEVQLTGWRESHASGALITLWLNDPSGLDAFKKLMIRKGNVAGQRIKMSLTEIPEPVAATKTAAASDGEDTKLKGGQLSRLAGMLCSNPKFPPFILDTFGEDVKTENECADFIRKTCGISSRAELDHNENAARIFHDRFRKPFLIFNERN